MRRGGEGPRIALLGLQLAVPAALLGTAWAGYGATGALLLAVLAPFALTRAVLATRLPTWCAAVLPLVATVAGLLVLAGTAGGVPWDRATGSVRLLLGAPQPAPATLELLLSGLLLAAVTGCLVAPRVLLPREATGQAGPLAALLGAVALYAAAALLTAGRADADGIGAAAVVGLAVLTPALSDRPTAEGRQGQLRTGVTAAVGLTALVVVVTRVLPAAPAFEPRRALAPPVVAVQTPDPLSSLRVLTAHPDEVVLRVRAHGADRLHLVTLPRFTGVRWQPEGQFRALGAFAEPDLPGPPATAEREVEVEVVRLGGPWLPVPGTVRAVSAGAAVTDVDGGDVAVPGGAVPRLGYRASGRTPTPPPAALAAADVPPVPPRYLDLPRLPAPLLALARQTVVGAASPFQQAVALEAAVAGQRTLDPASPGGTSYARLQTLLLRPAAEGGQVGGSEQYAAAFAVLARAVGLPTRLRVGFETPAPDSSGVTTVHGRDALAWPEVFLGGAGWVAFSPAPGPGSGDTDPLHRQVLAQVAGNAAQQAAAEPGPPGPDPGDGTDAGSGGPASSAADGRPGGTAAVIVAGGSMAVVLAALLSVLLLARRARRRRHRRAGPRGAWADLLDSCRVTGQQPQPSAPAERVAAQLEALLPATGAAARRLASAADAAAFAPAPAVVDGPAREPDRPEVWRDLRLLQRALLGTLPRWRRPLAALDPRPLAGPFRRRWRRSGGPRRHAGPAAAR